jgi:hypothetical protein
LAAVRRALILIGIALIGPMVWAATANADERFVTTGGAGSTCSALAPCKIETGVNDAGPGDEVIIAPGTYSTATGLSNTQGLSVHGQTGHPRPVIRSSADVALYLSSSSSEPVSISDLSIRHTGDTYGVQTSANEVTLERLDVRSTGLFAACEVGPPTTVRDTLCVSDHAGAAAFDYTFSFANGTAKLRGITAIATGASSTGVTVAVQGGPTTSTLDARNVIAQGTAQDVNVHSQDGSTVTATFHSSNYNSANTDGGGASVTAPGTGGNQLAPPVFADTTLYHQAPSSPTVDAGTVSADNGTTDLDGDARPLGMAIDIGADELVPDLTPPETTISKGPKKKTKSKKAKFKFNSSEADSSFECKVDDKAFNPCDSPAKIKGIKKGKHKFAVRATDAAGNADASPATYKWKVKKRHKHKRR